MTQMTTISLPVTLKKRISNLGKHNEAFYEVIERILDEYETLQTTKGHAAHEV